MALDGGSDRPPRSAARNALTKKKRSDIIETNRWEKQKRIPAKKSEVNMGISFVFSAAFVILLLVGAGLVGWRLYQTSFKTISLAGVVIVLVAVLGLSLIPGSFHTVEAGQIAVVKHLGEAKMFAPRARILIFGSRKNMTFTMQRCRIWISAPRLIPRMRKRCRSQ